MRLVALLLTLTLTAVGSQAAPLIVAFAQVQPKPHIKMVLPAPARPAHAVRRTPPALPADDAYNFFQLIAVQPEKPKPAEHSSRAHKAPAAKRRAGTRRKTSPAPSQASHA